MSVELQKLVDTLPTENQETSKTHFHDKLTASPPTNDASICIKAASNGLASARSFVLLVALSIHTVFEGLAIGMQHNTAEVRISQT